MHYLDGKPSCRAISTRSRGSQSKLAGLAGRKTPELSACAIWRAFEARRPKLVPITGSFTAPRRRSRRPASCGSRGIYDLINKRVAVFIDKHRWFNSRSLRMRALARQGSLRRGNG